MTTTDPSTLSQYVIVRINQDADEAPIDIARFVDSALHAAAFFREDVRLLVHEVEEPVWEAARRGATRVATSVDDYVSVEPTDGGAFVVLVWTADGHSAIVHRDTDQGACERRADKIRETLRTWDGWK